MRFQYQQEAWLQPVPMPANPTAVFDYVCNNGVWKQVSLVYVCKSGVWKSVSLEYVCKANAWKSLA